MSKKTYTTTDSRLSARRMINNPMVNHMLESMAYSVAHTLANIAVRKLLSLGKNTRSFNDGNSYNNRRNKRWN